MKRKAKACILVVEDDPAILGGLQDVLVFNGYEAAGTEDHSDSMRGFGRQDRCADSSVDGCGGQPAFPCGAGRLAWNPGKHSKKIRQGTAPHRRFR